MWNESLKILKKKEKKTGRKRKGEKLCPTSSSMRDGEKNVKFVPLRASKILIKHKKS